MLETPGETKPPTEQPTEQISKQPIKQTWKQPAKPADICGAFTMLLIDSDSCPVEIRSIILKACARHRLAAVFAADRPLPDVQGFISEHTYSLRQEFLASGGSPDQVRSVKSPIRMEIVSTGDNSADDRLVDICWEGCLSITRDILLASRLIEKGSLVITDRGAVLDSDNIRQRLSERDSNAAFREAGLFDSGKNKRLAPRDIRRFANALSALLQLRN